MTTLSSPQDKHLVEFVAGGSTAEIAGGIAAVVLAILGLADVVPRFMLTIATIAIGAALLFEGASIAAEYSRLLKETTHDTFQSTELGGGMTAEMMAGVAGIVLGILALLGLDPMVLSPAALIVFGVALVFGSGITSRLNDLKIETSGAEMPARRVAHEAVSAAAGTEILVGLSAGVLGILALVGIAPMTLSLIGMLAVGASVMLSGTAIGGKLLSMFRSA